MEKRKPKEQPWVLMTWISFLAVIITVPMIWHRTTWVYRIVMFAALAAILGWSALLLRSSLKEARAAELDDKEADTAPVGTGGPVHYAPLALGVLVGACALGLGFIALVPQMAHVLLMVLIAVGVGVFIISMVYRRVTRDQDSQPDHDPAAEQVRSAEVPEEEK
jgi:membrane protein implicated in regulation of membrane protease activity